MKLAEVKWGIIGCGNVTEVKSGPALQKVAHSSLVAVMRRSAFLAEDYARRHQVPRWYSDATEIIADPEVNAVYVATPPILMPNMPSGPCGQAKRFMSKSRWLETIPNVVR